MINWTAISDVLKAWGPAAGIIALIILLIAGTGWISYKLIMKILDDSHTREMASNTALTNHLEHTQAKHEESIKVETQILEESRKQTDLFDRNFNALNSRMDKEEERSRQFERDLFGRLGS